MTTRRRRKRTLLVGLLTTLLLMTSCRTESLRPDYRAEDHNKVFSTVREGCIPVDGGAWRCSHSTMSTLLHTLVDQGWDIKEAKDYAEYLEKKGALKVESLEAKLAECRHNPWCLGPVVAAVSAAIGLGIGLSFSFK